MDADGIVNLIIILIFLFSGVVRRLVNLKQGGQEQETQQKQPPKRPQPSKPGAQRQPPQAPTSSAPRPSPAPAAYAQQLLEQLEPLRAKAQLYRDPSDRGLGQTARYAPIIKQLQKAITGDVDRAIKVIDETGQQANLNSLAVQRAMERVEDHLSFAKNTRGVLDAFTNQRLKPTLRARLEVFDDIVNAVTGGAGISSSRKRSVVLWDGHPSTPSSMIGEGDIGLVGLYPNQARSVLGTVALARNVGWDLLAAFPKLRGELREAVMVGPLVGRQARSPYYVGATYDVVASVAAWAPALATDILGAMLVGETYGRALVAQELQAGLTSERARTIKTNRGVYHGEPPALIRLAATDAVAVRQGLDAESSLETLKQRLDLPDELLFTLPNGVRRTFQAKPLIQLVDLIVESLLGRRFHAMGEQRFDEAVHSGYHSSEIGRIHSAQRAFERGDRPSGSPVTLWLGAVEAEIATGQAKVGALVEALTDTPSARAPGARRHAASPALDARALFRDAYVLSEIL